MHNLVSLNDISNEHIFQLFDEADKIIANGVMGSELAGFVVGLFFFEASTRTQLSFAAAAQRLGATTIGFSDVANTSVSKGESLVDTVRVAQTYCDAVVMRHPQVGGVEEVKAVCEVPIINAGDGGNEHPTQTLFELYTLKKRLNKFENLKIGFSGDIARSRTIRSFARGVSRLGASELTWIMPEGLDVPAELEAECATNGANTQREFSISEVISELDVLYVNRWQKERWESDHQKPPPFEVLTAEIVRKGKPSLVILDPLPRVEEMSTDVDDLPNAAYFEAVENSVPIRMAILRWCLEGSTPRY